jgi:hypothetical protein
MIAGSPISADLGTEISAPSTLDQHSGLAGTSVKANPH